MVHHLIRLRNVVKDNNIGVRERARQKLLK